MLTWRLFCRGLAVVAAGSDGWAAFSFPGCDDVKESDFKKVVLVQRGVAPDPTLFEPVRIAIDMQANNQADVYIVERTGRIKLYQESTKKVTELANLDPFLGRDHGVISIALDPGFKINRWMYIYWTSKADTDFRLSRFTMAGAKLDVASEKIILKFPMQRSGCCHSGGGMAFDAYGDLWIGTGNNSPDYPNLINENSWGASAYASSGDPTDLRGGVLRIHPDENSPTGYTIPKDNFGEYWSKEFAKQGLASLAAQYADPKQVYPEIYVKGTRSNYSLAVDPYSRWMAWGEFGPGGCEEHNLVTHPTFAGYPYLCGANGASPTVVGPGGPFDYTKPMNNSKWNTGPKQLPPAEKPIRSYTAGGSGGATGPIYRYDGKLASSRKFPPHFDKSWFVTDFGWKGMMIFKPNAEGTRLTDSLKWFDSFNFDRPLAMEMGPDGALYVVNYAGRYDATAETAILRIEYTGTCQPSLPELPTVAVQPKAGLSRFAMAKDGRRLQIDGPGEYQVSIADAVGRDLYTAKGRGRSHIRLQEALGGRRGIFWVSIKGYEESRVFKLVDF